MARHATQHHAYSESAFLLKYWHGQGPLWRVFWLYGVLTSHVLAAIYIFAMTANAVALQQVLLPLCFLYTLWIVVSVWRCAPNTSRELYMYVARALTVPWALNTIFIILFLQMELVSIYLG